MDASDAWYGGAHPGFPRPVTISAGIVSPVPLEETRHHHVSYQPVTSLCKNVSPARCPVVPGIFNSWQDLTPGNSVESLTQVRILRTDLSARAGRMQAIIPGVVCPEPDACWLSLPAERSAAFLSTFAR